jgi:hypothetical protein
LKGRGLKESKEKGLKGLNKSPDIYKSEKKDKESSKKKDEDKSNNKSESKDKKGSNKKDEDVEVKSNGFYSEILNVSNILYKRHFY